MFWQHRKIKEASKARKTDKTSQAGSEARNSSGKSESRVYECSSPTRCFIIELN